MVWRSSRGSVFQSPCAGNMFGKCIMDPDKTCIACKSFNPRVRGTCLVSYAAPLCISQAQSSSFNPRVRGTCLVSFDGPLLDVEEYPDPEVSIPVCGEHVW